MNSETIGPVICLIGYLAGSIPFGLIFSKLFGAADPRTAGSGNIGFTNVLRVSGKKVGFLTLFSDFGKGLTVSWLAMSVTDLWVWPLVSAFCVVLGHIFPIFLGFHGGKGVATGLGAILGLDPMLGGIMIGLWLSAVGIWRYSSGGALAAFLALPILSIAMGKPIEFITMALCMTSIIFYKHTGNIKRLWNGSESRIGLNSS